MTKKIIQHTTRLALLTALCCVLRFAMAEFPNIKPITALFFAFVLFLGVGDSLIIMALTMLLTGLILGFSPIILGQIIVYALLIFLFKLSSQISQNVIFLAIISALLAFVFGALIDLISGWLYGFGTGGYIAYWLAGLPFDIAHALSTLLFYPVVIFILNRVKASKFI